MVEHKPLFPSQLKYQGPTRYIKGHQHHGKKLTEEHKAKVARKLQDNGRWKGGRILDKHGYVQVKRPGHPYADNRGYVREHRLVMEEYLGRYLLPGEVVHHINEVKDDNRIENLVLVANTKQHNIIERTGKKYPRKSGVWFTCHTCGAPFYKSAYYRDKPVQFCSKDCRYPKPSPLG